MSSVWIGRICFRLYPEDHEPRHAHGEFAGIVVVVNLLGDRTVELRDVQPATAKRTDVKKILKAAGEHFDKLVAAWEEMHP
ncbi:MAG: DUF4160 domain-containing protein [Vulcanimicrobiaceae bacterium]